MKEDVTLPRLALQSKETTASARLIRMLTYALDSRISSTRYCSLECQLRQSAYTPQDRRHPGQIEFKLELGR